jgi:hypothetical protein
LIDWIERLSSVDLLKNETHSHGSINQLRATTALAGRALGFARTCVAITGPLGDGDARPSSVNHEVSKEGVGGHSATQKGRPRRLGSNTNMQARGVWYVQVQVASNNLI